MKDVSWLTPELLAEVVTEYKAKAYQKDITRRVAAQHVAALVLNSLELGQLALEAVVTTPDMITASLTMLSSGIQLGLRLAEKKEGEPWLNQNLKN